MKPLTVKRLAHHADVAPETVRHYVKIGLIPEPPRGANGYRQFPPASVDRVVFIKRAQRLGFQLDEIRQLLAARDDPTGPSAAAQTLGPQLERIDHELVGLTEFREEIASLLDGRSMASPP